MMRNLKVLIALLLIQLSFRLEAQWVDSASVNFSNDTLNVYIEGDVFIYDFDAIKRVSDTIVSDSVLVDVVFLPCSPLQTFAPYDTLFSITGSFVSGVNHLRLYTILWEDTIGGCYGHPSNQTLDTVSLSFNVPLSSDEFFGFDGLKVFPNPTSSKVSIQVQGDLKRVQVLNVSGNILQNVKGPKDEVDLSALAKGIYFLKIETEGGIVLRKVMKE
ncbi:T9SS type A sorting domain-containing protein [Owenweeksia hongkongensis]|uniref:T9SS type A sorting domain-containing protein n=1 Tax=Owenweeksia hongkongensis TaxID=253245 RepID=UPI003A9594A6